MVKSKSELLEEYQGILVELLDEAKTNTHILSIVYDDAIKPKDIEYFLYTLEKFNIQNFVLLLHGIGGCTNAALLMAEKLGRMGKYTVCIPLYCGSALVYLSLKANQMIWLPTTRITQIDPYILDPRDPKRKKELRVIKELDNLDPEIKIKCHDTFCAVRDKIIELIKEKPSLYDHKKESFEDFGDGEELVSIFMNKKDHESKVHYKELKRLNYSIKLTDDEDLMILYENIIKISLNILRLQKARFMIASSSPYRDPNDTQKEYHGIFFWD